MDWCRIRGSSGDSHARILDLSSAPMAEYHTWEGESVLPRQEILEREAVPLKLPIFPKSLDIFFYLGRVFIEDGWLRESRER